MAFVACIAGTLCWTHGKRKPLADILNNSTVAGSRRVRLVDDAWLDILSCLDRPTLDCAERLARRFHRLVTSRLGDKCFRHLQQVTLTQVVHVVD